MADLSLCGRAMVEFNFLPSRTLHPSRMADYESAVYVAALAAMPNSAAVWHRHWSRLILEQEGLLQAPVTDVAAQVLTVAVLQVEALSTLVRRIGAVLCEPRLRYAISGESVRALRAALGDDALRWFREGRGLHPGLAGDMTTNAEEALSNVTLAGHAALYAAFKQVVPEVAGRFFLKLPRLPQARASQGGAASGEIHHEVMAAIDSDTAMALAMTLQAGLAIGGGDDVSG
jgi:type III secretion protein K